MEQEDEYSESAHRPGWSFSVWDAFALYGWYILIVAVILVYLYRKAEPTIDQYLSKRADQEYSAIYHKNPDLAASRLAAQQAVVERLQNNYNADAEQFKKKLEEKEAKKKGDWLLKQNGSEGYRLGRGGGGPSTSSLKPEYNPLMGDTSSHSYRPQRKSPCSGGGCGR